MPKTGSPSWDEEVWLEKSDTAWQRGLRLQQAWWRETQLKQPPGALSRAKPDRLVVSMLPLGVGLEHNLWTSEAREALNTARVALAGEKRPGLIQPDRIARNLLSSQPLCFNLFGYLSAHSDALLPWVRVFNPRALKVACVRLEWAPTDETLGGSAFDAVVEYSLPGGRKGFIGVECKYAEDLSKAHPKPAPSKYLRATREQSHDWKRGAESALDKPKLRQFWFNQLLLQRTARGYAEAFGAVVAPGADGSARDVVDAVRQQLMNPESLRFCALEELLRAIGGHSEWKQQFVRRYLDFTPVHHLLDVGDSRRLTR